MRRVGFSCLLIKFYMTSALDKIFLWNCRGAANNAFYRFCKQHVDVYHPDILVIMETRIDPLKIKKNSFNLLGFDGFLNSEVRGFAGGIVVAWKSSVVNISLLINDFQFLDLRVSLLNGQDWFFSPVYASPSEDLLRDLWTKLKSIAESRQGWWLVTGDFNDILSQEEKEGGAPINLRRCNLSRDRVNECGLMDMGSVGSRFTWRGLLWNGLSRIYEKLDRALCNSDWRLDFPDAIVKVIPRVDFSDHHPILISLQLLILGPLLSRPFRFESAWMTHDSFQSTIRECWSNSRSVPQNISMTEDVLRNWTFNTFGSIKLKKGLSWPD